MHRSVETTTKETHPGLRAPQPSVEGKLRAGGVCRQHVPVLTTNLRASMRATLTGYPPARSRFTRGPKSKKAERTSLFALALARRSARSGCSKGPLCRGAAAEESPKGRAQGCARVCRQAKDGLSTNPAAAART